MLKSLMYLDRRRCLSFDSIIYYARVKSVFNNFSLLVKLIYKTDSVEGDSFNFSSIDTKIASAKAVVDEFGCEIIEQNTVSAVSQVRETFLELPAKWLSTKMQNGSVLRYADVEIVVWL